MTLAVQIKIKPTRGSVTASVVKRNSTGRRTAVTWLQRCNLSWMVISVKWRFGYTACGYFLYFLDIPAGGYFLHFQPYPLPPLKDSDPHALSYL